MKQWYISSSIFLSLIYGGGIALSLVPSKAPMPRRRLLLETTTTWIITAGISLPTAPSHAVAPLDAAELETGYKYRAMRLLRPQPPRLLRPPLARDFAVMLLRASYNATDALDIIAMDQFQRDFFLIRAAEYAPYLQQLGGTFVTQGDITDANYFDFIALAQYRTIQRALADPAAIFEEQQPILDSDDDENAPQRFQSVVVRRTVPKDQLVTTFDTLLGRRIVQYFYDTYNGTPSALVIPQGPRTIAAVQTVLTQLVKLFLLNGFAWDGNVQVQSPKSNSPTDAAASGTTFCLTLVSPASLWSHQCLQRGPLGNDYLLKAARQLLVQDMGLAVAKTQVQFQDNCERSFITLR